MRLKFLLVLCLFISAVVRAQTVTVYFDFNSFMLNTETKRTLNQYIAEGRLTSIGFFGHTDQMGSVEYNDWLSVQRALAVKDYFLSKGIKETEFSVVRGFGAERLITMETDSISRQLNRRVSVTNQYKPTVTDLAAAAKQAPTYYTPSPNLVKNPVLATNSTGVPGTKTDGKNTASVKVEGREGMIAVKPGNEPVKKPVEVETITRPNPTQATEIKKGNSAEEEDSFAGRLTKTVNNNSSPAKSNSVGPVVKQQKHEKLIEDIRDKTTREGEHIVLKNIYFTGGRHSFLAKSFSALDDLLETMQKIPTLVIEIQGHVCCHEGDGDEIDFDSGLPVLSVTRAKAVYDFLVENGINKTRISYIGLAHKFPLIKVEKSEADAEANRRVEIKIVRK